MFNYALLIYIYNLLEREALILCQSETYLLFVCHSNLCYPVLLTCRDQLLAGVAYLFRLVLLPHETWVH